MDHWALPNRPIFPVRVGGVFDPEQQKTPRVQFSTIPDKELVENCRPQRSAQNYPCKVPLSNGLSDRQTEVLLSVLGLVGLPSGRIAINICPHFPVIRLISDHMIVEGGLKYFWSRNQFPTKPAGQRFIGTNHIHQRRAGACSRRLFIQPYNGMNVIGHDDVFIDVNGRIPPLQIDQLFFCNLSAGSQPNLGGTKAPPYADVRQNTPAILRADGHKIASRCVIMVFQPRVLPFRQIQRFILRSCRRRLPWRPSRHAEPPARPAEHRYRSCCSSHRHGGE